MSDTCRSGGSSVADAAALRSVTTEAQALRHHAMVRPEHIAIHFNDRRITYAELDARASQVACGISELGVEPGGRVGVLTKNSDEYFQLLFGLIRANRVAVPINWRLSATEIAYILRDSGTDTLFIGANFRKILDEVRAATPALRNVIVLGDDVAPDGFAAWVNRPRDPAAWPLPVPASDDVMIQFYTSGTTGRPKGVQITHWASRQMRLLEVGHSEHFAAWGPGDVAIMALPNSHLSGTSWALQWFARGATCVVQEQIDAGEFLRAIQDFRVTQLVAVPTVLLQMLDHPRRPETDLSGLKLIYYGSAPISPQLLERSLKIFGNRFVQLYGMTETNGVLCYLDPRDHDLQRPHLLRSCGKPYPMVDLKIMSPDGVEMPTGQIGEICVKSPSLMKGYWNLPGGGLSNLMWGQYFRTGDGGYVDSDGYVYIVDRLKDMIVSGGENIYPAEIESVARELPSVKDIAVIGVPDERWGEAVMAIVVRRDETLTEEKLLDFLRSRIGGFKVPKSIVFLDALPYNASGKVLKRELRDRYGKGQSIGYVASR